MSIDAVYEASTYAEVLKRASSFLEQNNKDPHLAEWLMKERFSFTLTDLVKHQRKVMPEQDKRSFIQDIQALNQGRPPQHIVGHEWFYDRKFTVTKDTLIPRPETEEWFHRYIQLLPERSLKVLDLGTGSGVLAVSHKLQRPQDHVTAVDISEAALTVAQQNAENLQADVTFVLGDMMEDIEEKFDLIVSNPPYISRQEMNVMDETVLNHEPHQALFAENEGLYFYEKIARKAPFVLHPNGFIVLEYGYKQSKHVQKIFKATFPTAEIESWKDFNGNDRALFIDLKGETERSDHE